MSSIRLHKWVFGVLTRLYPGRYFSRGTTIIRPKRRPFHPEIEQYGERAAPTGIVAVDPITADMVTFAALHEPLPPVVQVAQLSSAAAAVPLDSLASAPATSPVAVLGNQGSSSWWRSEVYGNGTGATQARDLSLLSTLAGEQFKANLDALPNSQAPFVDPLVDFVPLKNKPVLSADPGLSLNRPTSGSDGSTSAGGSGSSTVANAGQSSFLDSAPASNPFAGLAAPGANATRLAFPGANAPGSDFAPNNGPVTTDNSSLITHHCRTPANPNPNTRNPKQRTRSGSSTPIKPSLSLPAPPKTNSPTPPWTCACRSPARRFRAIVGT